MENIEYEKEALKIETEKFRVFAAFLLGLLSAIVAFISKGDFSELYIGLLVVSGIMLVGVIIFIWNTAESMSKLLENIKKKTK